MRLVDMHRMKPEWLCSSGTNCEREIDKLVESIAV